MARYVPDAGTGHERLVIIGEAPGATEDAQGMPFVGAAGHLLMTWLKAVGLQRRDAYWTNVVPYRPKDNRIEHVSAEELALWTARLHATIAKLHDPWVLVPTGNVALKALTGLTSITKHRGSLYAYQDQRGRSLKVIPTIHPAAVFRTPGWERRCRHDWQRISEDLTFRDLRLPHREHLIGPRLAEVEDFVQDALTRADVLALDIETAHRAIVCVGFSFAPSFSITIPTTATFWGPQLPRIWTLIKALCAAPCELALQYGLYDAYWLADHGIALPRWRWDTLAMHHALVPNDDHALAYLASIDTRQPYWKDDAKDTAAMAKYPSNQAAFWTYNGIDVCVTRELVDVYHRRLGAQQRLAWYDTMYGTMFKPLLATMRHGIRVDQALRQQQYDALTATLAETRTALTALTGTDLYGKVGGLSTKKVTTYLYETLKLPKVRNRKTGAVTSNEVTIRRFMVRFPDKLGPAGSLILSYRRQAKLREFLADGVVDADGRMRCTYKFTTETGRLASSKNPHGTGRNHQNIDRELRALYVPDPGCLFLEADLSQAEDRVVKVEAYAITKRQALLDRARAMPWENDEHKRAATAIFKVPLEAVTKEQRYLAKRARHASNYGMGGANLSDQLLLDGIVRTPEECTAMLRAIFEADPEILEWQRAVRQRVMTTRTLTTPWGRRIEFTYDRLDDNLYRRAYAFVPQSSVADTLNQWGFVPLWAWLRDTGRQGAINVQVHDAVLVSAPPHELWDIMQFLRQSLERPQMYAGVPLTIPVEFKIGRTWAGEISFTRPPTREAFEAAVRSLLS